MKKGIILGFSGAIVVVVLLLAGSSVGAYVRAQVEEQEAGAIACGDSVSCSRTDQVVSVTNTGTGHGILGKTTSTKKTKAAVFGNATRKARGVYGKSRNGDGVYGLSANGYGVYGKNSSSGNIGRLATSSSGVYGATGTGTGVYGISNSGIAVLAASHSGDLIRAYDTNPAQDLRFVVENDGDVYRDGVCSSPASDFAEMLPAAEGLEPADVLVVGPSGRLVCSNQAYSSAVVGVYSTEPAYLGGYSYGEDTTGKVPLAIVGIVPVKVSAENGSICPGDLLTTSSTPGHAMKATEMRLGTVIGKALESLESGTGTIQMLVTLQ